MQHDNGLVGAVRSVFLFHLVAFRPVEAQTDTYALQTARSYGILAATAITSTGNSVVDGHLGNSPGTAATGFPPGVVNGGSNLCALVACKGGIMTDAVVLTAKKSARDAYTTMRALPAETVATALGGQTLGPGTYKSADGTFSLDGTLTLSGAGVYVFQTASTLITGASAKPIITLADSAIAHQDIYWVVGSSATLSMGTAGTFIGTLIAEASITSVMPGGETL
eukprot:gene26733-22032_t